MLDTRPVVPGIQHSDKLLRVTRFMFSRGAKVCKSVGAFFDFLNNSFAFAVREGFKIKNGRNIYVLYRSYQIESRYLILKPFIH
jgi:hypothetical protein